MSALMISVNIELAECSEAVEKDNVMRNADGSLSMGICMNDAQDIDKCESAILKVVYPSIRATLTDHLSEVSEKIAIKQAGMTKEVVANETPYRVDGEAGRFTFTTHSVTEDGKTVYNTATDVFHPLIGKGYYRTSGFKRLAIIDGDIEKSFRKTAASINRTRRQEAGGTPYRTLRDNTEREGAELIDFIETKTNRILTENSFAKDGEYCRDNAMYADYDPVTVNESMISIAADKCQERTEMAKGKGEVMKAEILADPVCYEDSAATVNVSTDDVNSKRLAGTRPVGGSDEKG